MISKKNTFISDMISQASNNGYQFANSYIALIHGPDLTYHARKDIGYSDVLRSINFDVKKRLATNLVDTSLPNRGIEIKDFATHSIPRKMAVGANFDHVITLSFLSSADMFERKYFSFWQNLVVHPDTNNIGLYSQYAKPWKILIAVLPKNIGSYDQMNMSDFLAKNPGAGIKAKKSFDSNSESLSNTEDIYFVELQECYPIEIETSQISYESTNTILKTNVKMAFRHWIDPVLNSDYHIRKFAQRDSVDERFVASGNVVINGKIVPVQPTTDQVGEYREELSPFRRFVDVARNAIRYSDPQELKRLVVNNGLQYLENAIGAEVVQTAAAGGQVIDAYRVSGEGLPGSVNSQASNILGNIR